MTHIYTSHHHQLGVGRSNLLKPQNKNRKKKILKERGCMDLQLQLGRRRTMAQSFWSTTPTPYPLPLRPQSKRSDSQQTPPSEDDSDNSNNKGDRLPIDWNKAWSNFRKKGKKTLFSQFNPDKYVSWNPRRSNYPLSEEVDPIKRTERSNLMLWTSPRFTLAGAIVVVTLLLIYTLLAPIK